MTRRTISPSSLSFLDIMFCGFGATVLLVLILSGSVVEERTEIVTDLRSEVVRLERELLSENEKLELELEARDSATEKLETIGPETELLRTQIAKLASALARRRADAAALRKSNERTRVELASLSEQKENASKQERAEVARGEKVRRFMGDGDRQYLTGLKLGGSRVLVLVDASASMLDETIVNVIRRRNMSDERKRNSPKWLRTRATVEWIVANLPKGSKFQVYAFNTKATATAAASHGKWLSAAWSDDLEKSINGLHATIPEGGTSLYHAFAAARGMSPRPDNIVLITDGLPTQGRNKPRGTTVSSKQRFDNFRSARKQLPPKVAVNTILMPMEGDMLAAFAFWGMAVDTDGSFLTPARDWP